MSRSKLNDMINRFGIFAIAILLIPVGVLVSDKFLSLSNIVNIFDAMSYLGILACGMAMVTYSGQLVDLSTPSIAAVGGFVAVLTLKFGTVPMFLLVVLSGALLGAMNGLVIGKFRINTVVWTLAISFVLSGLIRATFGSSTIYPTQGDTQFLEQISRYRIGGTIPICVAVLLLVYIVMHIVVSGTILGKKMKMVGCSETVAQFSGVNVNRIILFSFICSGIAAAVTGLFIASLSKSACYNFGSGYEFDAITAIVLSGMLLSGGKGSIVGVLGGVLTIGLLNNIMTLFGLNTFLQDVVTGAVFIIVVWATNYYARKLEAKNG